MKLEDFQIPYVHIYIIFKTPKQVKNCIMRQMFKSVGEEIY